MNQNIAPDKALVSVCGLFCHACGVYYSTLENNEENLKKIALRMNLPYEKVRCTGCRTQTKMEFCKDCFMIKCADERGVDFCGQCNEFPCDGFKEFQSKMPHRVELWKSQERIKEIGWEAWFNEMIEHYTCKECGTMNGWYDFSCRECGHTPGSTFVEQNISALKPLI